MFGKPVTLNVFGKKRHRTLFGATVSLCATIFFIFAFQKKFKEFVKDESINVIYKTFRDNLDQIPISPYELMFAIRFDLELLNPEKRVPYSFKIQHVIQTKEHDSLGVRQTTISNKVIPVEPCTLSDLSTIESFFEDVSIDQYICPSIKANYTLQGNLNQASYQYLKIEIVSCQNESNCWTQNEIDEYISKNEFFRVQLIFNSYLPSYDEGNYLKSFIYDKKVFRMIPYHMKPIVELFFAKNNVLSDESWFWFSEVKNESYVMYSEEEFRENTLFQSTSNASIQNYGQFLFQRSSNTLQINRNFEKVDSVLSYMGGFIQMIFVFTGFIMEFYNMQSLMAQLANQLYSFETPTELTDEDKNVLKFSTRQQFLQSIFSKIFSSVKKISLNPSFIIYRLSFQKLLKTDNNILLHEAMKQVDQDLNIFEILDRLHEVDKMKKVLFTTEQKKIFEFSYKPTFNLELINRKMLISQIQNKENERLIQQKKNQQIQKQNALNNNKPSIIILDSGHQIQNGSKDQSNQIMQEMQLKKNCIQKYDFDDIVNRVVYFINQKNLIRVNRISQLLQEQGLYNSNQSMLNSINSQLVSNLSALKDDIIEESTILYQKGESAYKIQKFGSERLQQNEISTISSQSNYKGYIYNQSSIQENSPLQQYLNQGKKFNNNLLLTIIELIRPQTFYSQRVDYSKFSAFYELYEACQISLNPQKNTRTSIEVTLKIVEFLGKDIREVFQLAKRLQDERELQKQQRIIELVQLFIKNIKTKIGKPFALQTFKLHEDNCFFSQEKNTDQNILFKDQINFTDNNKTDRNKYLLDNQSSYNFQQDSNQLYSNLTTKNQWNEEKLLGNLSIQKQESIDQYQSIQNSPPQQKEKITSNNSVENQIKKLKHYQINNPQRQSFTQNGEVNRNTSLKQSQLKVNGHQNVGSSIFRKNSQFKSKSISQMPQCQQEHLINLDNIQLEQIDKKEDFEQDNINEECLIRVPSDDDDCILDIPEQNNDDKQNIEI